MRSGRMRYGGWAENQPFLSVLSLEASRKIPGCDAVEKRGQVVSFTYRYLASLGVFEHCDPLKRNSYLVDGPQSLRSLWKIATLDTATADFSKRTTTKATSASLTNLASRRSMADVGKAGPSEKRGIFLSDLGQGTETLVSRIRTLTQPTLPELGDR